LGNSWLFPSPFAFSKSTGNGFLQWTIYIHIYVYIYTYVLLFQLQYVVGFIPPFLLVNLSPFIAIYLQPIFPFQKM
jgi:fatty acid desaturase